MAFIKYNPNPQGKNTGDCVVRALSIAEGLSWDEAFKEVANQAFKDKDMPSMNPVWADYLIEKGYILRGIPNTCPRCYTVADFAKDHPKGTYVLGTGSHAIAVIDGNYIDAWNSGDITPMYYLEKKEENRHGSNESVPNNTTVHDTTGINTTNTAANAATYQPSNSGSVLGPGIGGGQGLPS